MINKSLPTTLKGKYLFEPRLDKTNKMAMRPAKTQISLGCPHEETLGPQLPIERTAKSLIRLGRMPRLI